VAVTILDGPIGTELAARGVPTPPGEWSAWAITHAPEQLAALHAEYAAAGATVHTANTFRAQPGVYGADFERILRQAVALARGAVPNTHLVAGSIAPINDCYEPWRSPPRPCPAHRQMAQALAAAGVDRLLCETFPHVGEGLIAVEEAVATGLPTWAAFTAGPEGALLSPQALGDAAREAVARGASAVLVNCVPARLTLGYVERLVGLGVPFGAYANAGAVDEGVGWGEGGEDRYLGYARRWAEAGATLIGGCCGTTPAHIAALQALNTGVGARPPRH